MELRLNPMMSESFNSPIHEEEYVGTLLLMSGRVDQQKCEVRTRPNGALTPDLSDHPADGALEDDD